MNRLTFRFHPILSLLLALTLTISSLAVSARSTAASGITAPARTTAPAGTTAPPDGPDFPDCTEIDRQPSCANLQVFLLIDDSSSMLYSDRTRQRLEGVKNVLDILAKEYYLPAVDANAKDRKIKLPNIQVSLIHYSSAVLHNSGWKTINPQSIDEWTTQLAAFDADLKVEIDYTKAQSTDFRPALQAAAKLAADQPQKSDCPRLVMLFTDGVPNLGVGNLHGKSLTNYMKELKGILQPTFNLSKDALFVTAFGSDRSFESFWNRDHKKKWEDITRDTAEFDPRRVQYVATQELAPRMERIIGSTIGEQVNTLTPVSGNPQQYTTEIPITVESLRLTYYSINTTTSFTVTGPDGKMIPVDGENVVLTGANTSIQVLEILKPAPGPYQITTTTPGGVFTQLLRFEKITAKLSSPTDAWLQFTNGQIGIQLFGADGKPLAISRQISIQAALTQAGQSNDLALTSGSDTFTTNWMPLTPDEAAVDACATIKDSKGRTVVLFHGLVGVINIDPVTVQVGKAENGCVPTEKGTSVPLQLINGSQQPVTIDVPVQWTSSFITSPGGTKLSSTISEIDVKSGKYVLRFKPTSAGDAQFKVTAGAIVSGVSYGFYNENTTIGIQPPRKLALTQTEPNTLGDRLSVMLYRGFHPGCIDKKTVIVFGRHVFDWFGPTQVQISGRFMDTTNNAGEPDIERFAVQLVSPDGGPSSETLSSWTVPETGGNFSTVGLRSPGLGLYNVTVTDQGENLECAVVESLPNQSVLLINDYWEYLIILFLIIFLMLLILYLFRRYRMRRYGHEIPLILSSVVLVIVNVILVNLLVSQTLKCELNCAFLIDDTLNVDNLSLCSGVAIPYEPIQFIPSFTIGPLKVPSIDIGSLWDPRTWKIIMVAVTGSWTYPGLSIQKSAFPILPALAKEIDPMLEILRQFIARTIVVFLALGSLVVALIASKISGFVSFLMTSRGRRVVLTNVSIWLLFFVILCSLFYKSVVASVP